MTTRSLTSMYEVGTPSLTQSRTVISFPHLPLHVVEIILRHLSFSEVSALRGLCRGLKESCGRILRVAVRRLTVEINVQLEVLNLELLSVTDPDNVVLRVQLLRCYNALEVLRAELRMICALCRSDLATESKCFPAGHLLDHCYSILQKVKQRDIPFWSLENDVTANMLRVNKKFLDSYIREYPSATRIGVRIVDLMDILIDAEFTLTVTYDRSVDLCHVVGEYELGDAKFLSLPPELPIALKTGGRGLTDEDVRNILEYLINIVRFNNRMLLREEQYWREMEATRRAQQDLQQQGYAMSPAPRSGVISRQPREYFPVRICRERRILSNDGLVIRESYKKYTGRKNRHQGFSCCVDLTCPLNECPLEVMENWSRLRLQINAGKDLEFIRSNHEIKVQILGYLELPHRVVPNLANPALYGTYDTEEVVGVHYPLPQQQHPSPLSFQGNRILTKEFAGTEPTENHSTTSSESRCEEYNVSAEIKVCIPVRGFEAEVYKMSIKDGNQDVQETELDEVICDI